ncbi:hypothetical protein SCHPADRAFT_1000974 [Schizopora paradoxa]|uniref:BTB domain-containing protein n=1 Tax=Schizopora paradoxa TaxID=27342 RepID=A0A0H2R948_9AGAM|nr:hypothetical protein SCHPADRAFT_1000974 [Schizopora paradoxa]
METNDGPRKKRRTSKSPSRDEPVRHDILWFLDGNVVLSTKIYLFRVHKSILSLHSSVFCDMFQLVGEGSDEEKEENDDVEDSEDSGIAPHNHDVNSDNDTNADKKLDGDSDSDREAANTCSRKSSLSPEGDTYEGLPLVDLAGEDGEGVSKLLRAVYERDFYHRDDNSTSLETIVSLLLLSTKYNFKHIRTDVIIQISRQYPMSLNAFCALDKQHELFGKTRDKCSMRLLQAAIQADVYALLPILFYACAKFPISSVAFNPCKLPEDYMETLVLGKEELEGAINSFVSIFPCSMLKISGANECKNKGCASDGPFFAGNLGALVGTASLTDIEGERVVEKCFRACRKCRASLIKRINEQREAIWSAVPDFFGYDDWGYLQGKLDGVIAEGRGVRT